MSELHSTIRTTVREDVQQNPVPSRVGGAEGFDGGKEVRALGGVGGEDHVCDAGLEEEDVGAGVAELVGGGVFGYMFGQGAEPGAEDDCLWGCLWGGLGWGGGWGAVESGSLGEGGELWERDVVGRHRCGMMGGVLVRVMEEGALMNG